ncbi:hypothetical protein CO687_02670 [Streptococcus gordonii]|uniref:hypothetical protein n=1 Tax=Streptococcus gordonii TaxID=1302 RepID=UPI000BBD246B|nr:hypothetical protein [Streptococcus gordonii]ATF64454.1 hypothetical protein CO687_02670 [Streptococcus gordonii]
MISWIRFGSLEASLHSIRGMYNAMVGDESTSASTLSSFSNRMDSLTGQRNERMDKLRKLNMFAGSGKTKGNKTTTNYYGLKLSTDINDGILAGYNQRTESEKRGDWTNSKEFESGIQIGNTGEVIAVGAAILTVVQPEFAPYTIPFMGKLVSGN